MALKYICAYKMLQLAGKAAPSDKEVPLPECVSSAEVSTAPRKQ